MKLQNSSDGSTVVITLAKLKKNIILNENAIMMLYFLHGKVRMLIVCHPSYQDKEAIVYMKQNAIIPTEQQYRHNATETLIIDN